VIELAFLSIAQRQERTIAFWIKTLEKAQHVEKSTHKILEDEATKCLAVLTEDARSI